MSPAIPANTTLACANCGSAIPPEDWNGGPHTFCAACRAPITALVFPAFFRKPESSLAARAEEGDASCFYHPAKKAAVTCDQCGRFLCTLCQIDLEGQNWCPVCVETRRQKGKLVNLETRRTLYDSVTLHLSIWPVLIMWPATIISAPMALYLGLRHRNAPLSMVRRTRIRLYIGLTLAALQALTWLWVIGYLISRI